MEPKTLNKMGVKPILPLLLSMAFPPMISMLIQALYNIIDSMFVAQVSEEALTAVSLAFPIQNLIIALSVGIGVGVNSYISRKLGENNQEEANSAVLHGLILSSITACIFTILGLFIISPFFSLFTENVIIFEEACTYTNIVVLFCIAPFLHICIEKIFQSTGNMLFPMGIQAIGAITNIILDPIMIFGFLGFPAMGVAGAAIATVIGQVVAMLLSLFILFSRKHDVQVDCSKFKIQVKTINKILAVASPNACMNALGSFLTIGLNAILIKFSNLAVAVFGVYFKLQTFVFMPVSGLTQGAMPIMGYNYGAKNRKRLMDTLKNSYYIAFIIMLCGFFLFMFFPVNLLRLFNATDDMLAIGVPALRIISISFLPATLGFILPTLYQSIGAGGYSLIVFLLRQLMITLPLSYLLSQPFGLKGVWVSFIVAEGVAAIVALILYAVLKKKDAIFSINETIGKEESL